MTLHGSPGAWRLFEVGFRPWLRTRLSGIHLTGLPARDALDPTLPLLLVANHTSWYDGFLLREIHRTLRPEGPLRTVMLRGELRGRPLLRLLGGVGFEPERPATFRSVLRTLAVRQEGTAAATVAFFPQGRIYPSFRSPLGFKGGVETVARHLRPLHLLPVGIHLEGGNRGRPAAYLAARGLSTVREGVPPTARELDSWVGEETRRIREFLARWGEEAPEHWEERGGPDRP